MSKNRLIHNGVWDGKSIFVFGSNLAGRHGRGAAKFALENCGAIYGEGAGRQGRSYAIPTKDLSIKSLPLTAIERHVSIFLDHAKAHPEQLFFVTEVGCGLAGYTKEDIAPMFAIAPANCILSSKWDSYLRNRNSAVEVNPVP